MRLPATRPEAKDYAGSIHGMSKAMGASAAAACADCHGSHDIQPVKHADSPVFKLNLPRTCAKCHSNPGLTAEYRMKYPQVAAQYSDSIHGRALLQMGLILAPSCNDCHGVHNIKRSVDRSSSVNHANVASTCGACHLGIEQTYNASIHGQLLAKGDPSGPVCTDCHSAHQIEAPGGNNFKARSDERCGRCHQDRLAHYRETYHGKAMALGRPNVASDVAACYDCHGHHDVLPPTNPASHLSKANIVATCQKCHPGATASFAKYIPHADPLDAKHYPQLHWTFVAMTALLIGVFAFFGAHTGLWLFRSGYLYLHDSKTFREAKIETQRGEDWFTRFPPFERFLHFLVVTSFLLLVITGMPLKFYYTDWAKVIFGLLGGADVARTLHHFGALITFLYFGLHLLKLLVRSWQGRARWRGGDWRSKWTQPQRGPLRPRLDDPDLAGRQGFHRAPEVVFRQGTQAAVRPLDLLGEVRLLRRVLGRLCHWRLRAGHVVSAILLPFPAGLDDQRRPHHPFRRGAAGGRLHLHHPLFQHPFPPGEISHGHRHLLRPHLQDRTRA